MEFRLFGSWKYPAVVFAVHRRVKLELAFEKEDTAAVLKWKYNSSLISCRFRVTFHGNLSMAPGTQTLNIWSSVDSGSVFILVDVVKPEHVGGYALSSTVTQSTVELNRKAWFTASPVFNVLARFETKVLFPSKGQRKVPPSGRGLVQELLQVLVWLHVFSGSRHILGWLSQYSAILIAALVAPMA